MNICRDDRSPHRGEKLADLRRLIGTAEGSLASQPRRVIQFGIPALDRHLPQDGLPTGALHEVVSDIADGSAATGFVLALVSRLNSAAPLLWCRVGGSVAATCLPYGPGLRDFGLAPERLILVEAPDAAEALWATEESLKTGGPCAVYVEGLKLDLRNSRRLQLAAERKGVTAFAHRPLGGGSLPPSAAMTRWLVSAAPLPPASQAKTCMWQIRLERCRGGAPGQWIVEWHEQALSFHLAAAVSH